MTEATPTQSNGANPGVIVETYETVFGTQPAQEAPSEAEAPKPAEQARDDNQDDGTNEGDSDTSAESGEQEKSPIQKAKEHTPKGVQKRLDELTRQKEDYKRSFEQAMEIIAKQAAGKGGEDADTSFEPVKDASDGRPRPEQYKTGEDFVEALTEWKLEQKLAAIEAKRAAETAKSRLDRAEAAARTRYEDYDDSIGRFARSPLVQNPVVLDAIQTSDIGPDIAYYLGKNPEVAAGLQQLTGYRLGARLAEIEDLISGKPPESAPAEKPKPVSKAPAPPGKLAGNAEIIPPAVSQSAHIDSSDMDRYVAARNAEAQKRGRGPLFR